MHLVGIVLKIANALPIRTGTRPARVFLHLPIQERSVMSPLRHTRSNGLPHLTAGRLVGVSGNEYLAATPRRVPRTSSLLIDKLPEGGYFALDRATVLRWAETGTATAREGKPIDTMLQQVLQTGR